MLDRVLDELGAGLHVQLQHDPVIVVLSCLACEARNTVGVAPYLTRLTTLDVSSFGPCILSPRSDQTRRRNTSASRRKSANAQGKRMRAHQSILRARSSRFVLARAEVVRTSGTDMNTSIVAARRR